MFGSKSKEIVETENTYLPTTLNHAGLKNSLDILDRDVKPPGMFLKLSGGEWVLGSDECEVSEDFRWAVNMYAHEHGFIAWPIKGTPAHANKQPPEEIMYNVVNKEDVSHIPTLGDMEPIEDYQWHVQTGIHLKCLNAPFVGQHVVYKTKAKTALAEVQRFKNSAVAGMTLTDDAHAKLIPVITLGKVKAKSRGGEVYWKPIIHLEDVYTRAEMEAQAEPDAEPEPEPEKLARTKRPRRTRA